MRTFSLRVFAPAALAAALLSTLPARPAHALRVVTWNLWQYPSSSLAARQPLFRTVIQNLNPDVLAVQEMITQAGVDSFLTNVLNVVQPGQWAVSSNSITGNESVIYYKPAKVTLTNVSPISTSGPRDVLLALVNPVGYTNVSAKFRVYSVHWKAGDTAPDSATRRLEATDLRNTINLAAANTNFLIAGDYNLYSANEGGYLRLTESQTDNDGRSKDPLTLAGNWHTVPSYALYYTQCPCNTGCLPGFSGGGMDDRFDLILSSYSMQDGEGVDLAQISTPYYAYGNDGAHYNDNINGGGFNGAVPIAVANALKDASDHLPVVFEVQLAAKVVAASSLDFGSVITGPTAEQSLVVSNGAAAPADDLDYSLAAPAGFTAPAGSFRAFAGIGPNSHAIGMTTGTTGPKSGTLVMTTDDRDSLTKNVLLSGRVLAHAAPSLDSLAAVTEAALDFGTHAAGAFPDLEFRVHNRGWNALQARLAVAGFSFDPGNSRFSIVGTLDPGLLSGVGHTFTVRFDAAGATPDSIYQDTLTVGTADEPLPGATALAPLRVLLTAHTEATSTGADDRLPTAVRFAAPRPNPLREGTAFAFELPRAAAVTIDVFDLAGRRVANVANAPYTAGRHEVSWRAREASGGRLGAGLYFARFQADGVSVTRRVAVLP